MTRFTITIVSDTVCPHCYLGRARLERAINLYRKTVPGGRSSVFTIRWHAYRLDRNPPPSSIPAIDVVAQRFGLDRLTAKRERMKQLGSSEGYNFTFGGWIGNTRDSHRVIQLGRTKGSEVEDKVAMGIMRMFFEEDGDITSWKDLSRVAVEAGIDAEETMKWLEAGKGGEEVDKEVEDAYGRGLKGVPTFYINDKYVVDGAADVSDFLEQLVLAKEDEEHSSAQQLVAPGIEDNAIAGEQCVDGVCVL